MITWVKKLLKHNQSVYRYLVAIIEFVLTRRNRIRWLFWKYYPFVGRKLANLWSTKYVPVLYFHWFVSQKEKEDKPIYKESRWYASIESFKKQIAYLKQRDYHFLSAQEYYQWYVGKVKVPRKSVLLTFDDGEQSLVNMILPFIKQENIPVLFFVIGKRILGQIEKTPTNASEDQIHFFDKNAYQRITQEPLITLGSHTYNMHFSVDGIKAVDYLSPEMVDIDFQKMQDYFSFDFFAAPYGKYNQVVYENVKKHHRMGFTVETPGCPYSIQGKDPYKIRRIRVDGLSSLEDLTRILR